MAAFPIFLSFVACILNFSKAVIEVFYCLSIDKEHIFCVIHKVAVIFSQSSPTKYPEGIYFQVEVWQPCL